MRTCRARTCKIIVLKTAQRSSTLHSNLSADSPRTLRSAPSVLFYRGRTDYARLKQIRMRMKWNMEVEVNNSETHPDDFIPAWPAKILRARDNAKGALSPEGGPPGTARARAEGVPAEAEQARRRGRGGSGAEERVLRREEIDRLSVL